MHRGRIFLKTLSWDLVLGFLIFALSVVLFLAFTLPMDNDFATYTRKHHVGTAVWTQIRTLPGYLILALAYAYLGAPWQRFRKDGVPPSRIKAVLRFLVVNSVIFVLSLGIAAVGNPAFLDALARHLSPLMPNADLYRIYDWHLPAIFIGCLALLAAYATWFYFGPSIRKRGFRSAVVIVFLTVPMALAFRKDAPSGAVHEETGNGKTPPNIVIIGSDSLRADHLSCYGYARKTSPVIDALASQGTLLESLHVATASTLESWTTILTGKFPVHHGLRYMFPSKERVDAASREPNTLPRILKAAGYHTAVSSNWAGNCFKLVDFGFDANHASDIQNLDVFIAEATLMAHWVYPLYFNNRLGERLFPEIRQITSYLNPQALVDRFAGELDVALEQKKPFFGILFLSTTHLPYAASWPWNQQWVDRSYRGQNRYQIDFEVDSFIQDGFREALSEKEVQHVIDLYDGTVSEFDATVGTVLELLRKKGCDKNTLVIITSDHGDDLYEPGTTLGHGMNFFGGDQTTQIPMILAGPGSGTRGTRVSSLTRTVDILPTFMEMIGMVPPTGIDGHSFKKAFEDPGVDLLRPAFAETCYLFFPKKQHPEGALAVRPADETLRIDPEFHNNFVLKEEYHQAVLDTKDRMIRTERWKLIEIPGKDGPIRRLYDMKADPRQQHDLSTKEVEILGRLASALSEFWSGKTDVRWSRDDDRSR